MAVDSTAYSTGGRLRRRPILVFLAIAFGFSWLVGLGLALAGGLRSPALPVLLLVYMLGPAIAALVVSRWVERPDSIPRALGISQVRPVGRFVLLLLGAVVLAVVLVLGALAVGALFGLYHADLTGFSGFRAYLEQVAPTALTRVSLGTVVALQFLNVLIGAFVNIVPSLGEELGWRGWLLPALLPAGVPTAVVVSGALWGLWHAPLILLGYNYPGGPGWLAVIAMICFAVVIGAVLSWIRMRTDSIWPVAAAHGAINAAAGFPLVFLAWGTTFSPLTTTILGWSGWLVPAVLVAVLAWRGQFGVDRQPWLAPVQGRPLAGPGTGLRAPRLDP
ncbi:CPBP family intramembrane glutamic endopeptidase [Tersicoccus sp. MR15.9]|uniref:CPBP family intramembrane glutamic endopeptidase n=1 Tax=Tersicoccus mangrovi TaxID=3121635 RepID=UPI002FE60078